MDDMVMNLVILNELLRDQDVETETATNGEEAVALSRKVKYDLILMDIQMPIMNGLEATSHIRNDKESLNVHTPIIAVSASIADSDRESFTAAGITEMLSKPFDIAFFYHLLSVYLEDKESLQQAKSLHSAMQNDTSTVTIDLNNLLRIGNNNRSFVALMLQSFIDSTTEIIGDMEQSLERKDWLKIAQLVHKLKFALNVMGAGSLDEEIKWIETHTKHPNPETENEMQVRIYAFNTVIRELYKHAGALLESGEWS